jgi:hypothetical protein
MPAVEDAGGAETADIWYRLDPDDRIIAIGGDNWASAGQGIVGSSVYDHVSGHFTRRFLKDFLGRARGGGALSRQCYRCDAPDAKRLMEMCAEMEDGRVLRVVHRELAVSALPFQVHVRDVPRTKARHLRCSSCNRLRGRKDVVWREPEDALKAGEMALVVHTICPDCRRGIDLRRQSSIFTTADLARQLLPTR